jgi:hypothetical protein
VTDDDRLVAAQAIAVDLMLADLEPGVFGGPGALLAQLRSDIGVRRYRVLPAPAHVEAVLPLVWNRRAVDTARVLVADVGWTGSVSEFVEAALSLTPSSCRTARATLVSRSTTGGFLVGAPRVNGAQRS